MEAHNIGQHKPSVKVNHKPGGQSNFSLYWNEPEKNPKVKPSNIQKYHNQSHFSLNQVNSQTSEEQRKKQEEEDKRKEQSNKNEQIKSKSTCYDPKSGGKSSLSFGNQPTDYRKKDEVFTSVKVKNPPGGRSNIQFG